MKALIIKDFLLSRKVLWITILFLVFWGVMGVLVKDPMISQIVNIYMIFFLTYYNTIVITQLDEKASSDSLVNSLPLSRRMVVEGRYIFLLAYPICLIMGVAILSYAINLIPIKGISEGRTITLEAMILSLSIVMIFLSIYMPITYLSIGKVKTFNFIFYLFLIVFPGFISRYARGRDMSAIMARLEQIPFNQAALAILMLSVIIYIASMKLSQKIYHGKDFY